MDAHVAAAAAAGAARDATRVARDDAAGRAATRETRELLSRLSRGEGDLAAACHALAALIEREQRKCAPPAPQRAPPARC
jgi:hypothetical protein